MTDKHIIKAETRNLFGRKTNALRRDGAIPANIYAKGSASVAIQVQEKDLLKLFITAGESGLVYVQIGNEKDTHPVLITAVQRDAVSGKPVHVDFHQVSLKEKVEATVPLHFIGESPAVQEKVGTLLTFINEVDVKALPTDLPEFIEVDLSTLKELDQEILVKDLTIDTTKIEMISDPELALARIGELAAPEPVEPVAVEETAEGEATEDASAKEQAATEEKPAE